MIAPLPPPAPPPDIAAELGARGVARDLCLAELRADGHRVDAAQPASADNAACVIPDAIRIESLALPGGGSRIAFPDRPVISCAFAKSVAEFSVRIAAPLALSSFGAAPASLATGPGYECRGRNRVSGAKISAHGKGVALDVASMTLANGRALSVEKPGDDAERRYWSTVRKAACGWFTTILGPGSDAAHANHIHLDAERHGTSERYRLCQ